MRLLQRTLFSSRTDHSVAAGRGYGSAQCGRSVIYDYLVQAAVTFCENQLRYAAFVLIVNLQCQPDLQIPASLSTITTYL